ncbi:hypothetical protein O1611_g3723 [Lasiodiplodia mahajangana]|uniref:Uncharacterized protein n=1 Tax=Lasiodiplodia mahajangana TaxID=1108764 RepID=A0ACC2JQY4_9PEZI|nr:hypothetical protein O1611_g3723 [Lasiodiplodia mahajangana]
MDVDNSPVFRTGWPDGNVYLVPTFLKTLQVRLVQLKTEFKKYIRTLNIDDGIDLEWMLVNISEPAFLTVQFIAEQVPPSLPPDAHLVDSINDLASQLKPIIGGDENPPFLSEIEALPNPQWDAVFKGYCKVLEASVDAFVLGDSPAYQPGVSNPDEVFHILSDLLAGFNKFPFLRLYYNRLVRKLGGSRSGVIGSDGWKAEETSPQPGRGKRKIKSEDLDDYMRTPYKKMVKLNTPISPFTDV